MKDPVAAAERLFEQGLVQHIGLHQARAGALEQVRDELAPAGPEVIDDHDLDTVGSQPIGERAADKPGAARDEDPLHGRPTPA